MSLLFRISIYLFIHVRFVRLFGKVCQTEDGRSFEVLATWNRHAMDSMGRAVMVHSEYRPNKNAMSFASIS
jgi:hypothetical protein